MGHPVYTSKVATGRRWVTVTSASNDVSNRRIGPTAIGLIPFGVVGELCSVDYCTSTVFLSRSLYHRFWRRHVDCVIDAVMTFALPSSPLDNIRVMVIVWRLRGNINRTVLCRIVWHNVHSQQHTYMSSSYRSNRLGLSHWDSYTVRRGSCLELYYCNMVEWFWCDSSLSQRPTGFLQCFDTVGLVTWPVKIVAEINDLLCVEWDVKPYTLSPPVMTLTAEKYYLSIKNGTCLG